MRITKEKIAIVFVAASIVTNPLSGQYIVDALNWAFTQAFIYGAYISLVAGVYIIGLLFWYNYQSRDKVKIPSKTAKTQRAGKLIET